MNSIKIFHDLEKVQGIKPIAFLSGHQKKHLQVKEDQNNLGVLESMKRSHTLLLTHDTSFREPVKKIVVNRGKAFIFPPIPFPEVKAKNVVSSSPSKKVHEFLTQEFNLSLKKDEATLLIGFDL